MASGCVRWPSRRTLKTLKRRVSRREILTLPYHTIQVAPVLAKADAGMVTRVVATGSLAVGVRAAT